MEDEGGAISQLGDLALGHILNDLGLKADGSGLQQLVGGKQTRPQQLLDQDQIYNEKFEDDDLDLGELPGAEEEEHGALNGSTVTSAEQDRFYKLGMDALRKGKSKVRGEDDDFDEDGEGDDADADGEVDMSASTPVVANLKTEPADLSMRSPSPSDPSLATPPVLPEPRSLDVKDLWPGFEPGKILNFTELFTTRPPKRRRLAGRLPAFKAVTEENMRPKTSTRDLLSDRNLTTTLSRRGGFVKEILENAQEEERRRKEEKENALHTLSGANQMLDALSLDDWENRILWQDEEGHSDQIDKPFVNVHRPHNRELDGGEWLDEIIWDEGQREPKAPPLLLDLNDPEMLLETKGDVEEKVSSLVRSDAPAMTSKALRTAAGLDAFNLSNDRFYEQSREHRMRSIRQTLGQLELQHSRPATKLQMPFYKTRLSKSEARDFHRPVMHFPSNIPLRFTRVRKEKRSKEEARSRSKKDVSQVLKSTRDLTLKDTSSFVLYEYSEEYPPVLPNLGMGSLLVNYYRKKDGRDEHIPRLDLGEGVVLDVSDESPFMKFGSVEPGRTQPTLYNRMIRAPLFRHKAATTDFLLIRSITKNEVRYYLRDIRNLFVVGQTYPIVPVPGPHARLVTNALKYRMQLITYKLLQKSIGERIKIHRIMKYFPDQNELQMRQRMKEFMEYHRRDKDQGFWKLKPDHVPPTEADLQSKLTPEHVCLIEAMQAGQRHLLDAGYTKTAEGYEDENQDESKMDVEQLLAPWVTTKNFLHATQGKAMLKLYGDGDPSSRGEAFSFLRVSMKDIFIRAGETESERMAMQLMEEEKSGHKYNVARQQEVYKGEVQRIWNAQRRALENPTPPKLTQEEQDAAAAAEAEAAAAASGARNKSLQHARSHSRAESLRRDASPSGSQDGTPTGDDTESMADSGKVLRIRRYKMGRWITEIVRETAVIHAYIRQRQRIEDERTATEALLPTGDAALDALRRKRLEDEIRSSLKNRDRRLQRKNAKALAEGLPIEGGPQALLNKTDTKRRCGRCGQVGHMSTNTSCPKFSAAQKDKSAEMALHGMAAGAGGAGAGAVPGALSGPGGHRPSMMGHQSSWFGASPNPSVPQSPMTPVAGAGSGALPSGYMTPGTPGGAQSPPATTAGSPAAAASAPSSGRIKLKIKR